jgi:hypothetical protein
MIRRLAISYVHNCIAHKWLFYADILDELGFKKLSKKIDAIHDWTAKPYK